ncbi:MAG: hypothetical protein AAF731_20345 [Bacteroidota bacterium]
MNRIEKLWSLLAIIIFVMSCQPSKTTENNETEEATTEELPTEEAGPTESSTVLINPNLATEEELEASGVNTGLITQIIGQRPFLSMTDLDALIGEVMDSTQKAELYGQIFVPFNLNTTLEGDFKLIPGVGNRMAHEFEEYRPYLQIAQFRKEIGKYVDETEVARLENYVFVPVELNTASKEEILAIPGVGDRMLHEFEEYRPYASMEQFRKEIGKYVDDKELSRLERFVYLEEK